MSKLYLISQNSNSDYDTYDSAVVVADTSEQAKLIDPSGYYVFHDGNCYGTKVDSTEYETIHSSWVNPDKVKAECIGEANNKYVNGEVVCASFNAG